MQKHQETAMWTAIAATLINGLAMLVMVILLMPLAGEPIGDIAVALLAAGIGIRTAILMLRHPTAAGKTVKTLAVICHYQAKCWATIGGIAAAWFFAPIAETYIFDGNFQPVAALWQLAIFFIAREVAKHLLRETLYDRELDRMRAAGIPVSPDSFDKTAIRNYREFL